MHSSQGLSKYNNLYKSASLNVPVFAHDIASLSYEQAARNYHFCFLPPYPFSVHPLLQAQTAFLFAAMRGLLLFYSFFSSNPNILREKGLKREMKTMKEEEKNKLLKKARIIADYQFGAGAGDILFSDGIEFILSRTRRISQIEEKGERIATLRSADGLLTLSIEGAMRLCRFFKYPRIRVVMNEESSEFIKEGGTAFCKHVTDADPEIKAYDEIIVVDEKDNLLATGKAMLSSEEMKSFKHGVAVKVRYGIK